MGEDLRGSASGCLSLKSKSFLIRERVNETGGEYCDDIASFFVFFHKLIEVPVECLKREWVCGVIRTPGKTEAKSRSTAKKHEGFTRGWKGR